MASSNRRCAPRAFVLALLVSAFPAALAAQPAGDKPAKPGKPADSAPAWTRSPAARSPATVRASALEVMEAGFLHGRATADDYTRLLERAGIGEFPASAANRKSLGQAVFAASSGRTFNESQSKAAAQALDAAVNADSATPDALAAHRARLSGVLRDAGAPPEQVSAVETAFDRVVADQKDEPTRRLLDAIQSVNAKTGPERRDAVLAALLDSSAVPRRAGDESLAKLADLLVDAVSSTGLSNLQAAQCARDLRTILGSAGLPQREFDSALTDLQSNLRQAHVPREKGDPIVALCRSIYAEVNKK
jgi:hypothetical protein